MWSQSSHCNQNIKSEQEASPGRCLAVMSCQRSCNYISRDRRRRNVGCRPIRLACLFWSLRGRWFLMAPPTTWTCTTNHSWQSWNSTRYSKTGKLALFPYLPSFIKVLLCTEGKLPCCVKSLTCLRVQCFFKESCSFIDNHKLDEAKV